MFKWLIRPCTHADMYETLAKRYVDLQHRVDALEINQDNMRNLARKIQRNREKATEETEETEDLRSKILIPV